MTPAAWIFLAAFAVLTILTIVATEFPAPPVSSTPSAPKAPSTPTETRSIPPRWTIAGYGDCPRKSLYIGNATDQEITLISGKFVAERHYSAKETEWHEDTELGGFVAELVPPHGWRLSISYGPDFCSGSHDTTRIRILRLDRCIINGRDLGNACAVNMQPRKTQSYEVPVVGLQ